MDLPQKFGLNFGRRKIGNMKIVGFLCHFSFGSIRSRDTDILAPPLYDRVKVWEDREANRNSSRFPHDEERSDFLNLIKKMIMTNPDERSLMTVLLTDPFMTAARRKEEKRT